VGGLAVDPTLDSSLVQATVLAKMNPGAFSAFSREPLASASLSAKRSPRGSRLITGPVQRAGCASARLRLSVLELLSIMADVYDGLACDKGDPGRLIQEIVARSSSIFPSSSLSMATHFPFSAIPSERFLRGWASQPWNQGRLTSYHRAAKKGAHDHSNPL